MKVPTVLLVDDEPNVLSALKRLLRKEPCEVVTAKCAEDALQILARAEVALIISDHRMPDMTGIDLFKISREKYPATLRMLLTAHADMKTAMEAINDGNVHALLTKPWDDEHLKRTISGAIEQHKSMARHVKLNRFIRSKNEALRQENLQRSAGIEQMSKRAAKVEEMKSNFAALAVHELHTPLSSLSSCVYMLQNFPDMSEDERRMIYEVLSSTTARLETLIGDVLNVIEEEQERPLRKIPMSLNEVVREVEKEVGPFIKKRNQTLVLCLAEELPPHEGDAGRIWQAVMNLVMNAIRFTPDGGIIVVATRAADDGVHLLVADTGIGIPREDYENIFEMFYEGIDVMHHCSGTIEFMSGSLGLGLPTAKSIVERHGGRISLSSAVGVGSTFTIELPALAKSSVNEPCAAREATSPESQ